MGRGADHRFQEMVWSPVKHGSGDGLSHTRASASSSSVGTMQSGQRRDIKAMLVDMEKPDNSILTEEMIVTT